MRFKVKYYYCDYFRLNNDLILFPNAAGASLIERFSFVLPSDWKNRVEPKYV